MFFMVSQKTILIYKKNVGVIFRVFFAYFKNTSGVMGISKVSLPLSSSFICR